MEKAKKSKTILLAVLFMLIALLIFTSFAYSKGYLDNLFNKKDQISFPSDYKEPSLTLKSEYSKGIIYENSEPFNIEDYIDYTAYNNEASIWYELIDEDSSSLNSIGEHKIIIYIKDSYDNQTMLETSAFTYNHSQQVLSNLEEGLCDGVWVSEDIQDTRFEFEIKYPSVIDSNGNVAEILPASLNTYDFSIIFSSQGVTSEFRVSDLEEDTALLWLPNEDGTYTTSLSFSKSKVEDSDDKQDSSATSTNNNNTSTNKKTGHYEMKLVKEAYDETIPAYDETVIVKDAWTEAVLVKEAWDEECTECTVWDYDYIWGYQCQQCGYFTTSLNDIETHIIWTDGCGNYQTYSNPISEYKCQEYSTYTVHHDAEYDYIYHEAETKVVHHEEKVVHHEAQYKKVWVED